VYRAATGHAVTARGALRPPMERTTGAQVGGGLLGDHRPLRSSGRAARLPPLQTGYVRSLSKGSWRSTRTTLATQIAAGGSADAGMGAALAIGIDLDLQRVQVAVTGRTMTIWRTCSVS
jgi:hypothetical protein